jgi:hypothetical protein
MLIAAWYGSSRVAETSDERQAWQALAECTHESFTWARVALVVACMLEYYHTSPTLVEARSIEYPVLDSVVLCCSRRVQTVMSTGGAIRPGSARQALCTAQLVLQPHHQMTASAAEYVQCHWNQFSASCIHSSPEMCCSHPYCN